MREFCNHTPVWLVVLAVLFTVCRIGVEAATRFSPPPSANIKWQSADTWLKASTLPKKRILLFLRHSKSCPACDRAERRLTESSVANIINEKYVPIELKDPREMPADELPADYPGKGILEHRNSNVYPELLIVKPEGWNVNQGKIVDEAQLMMSLPSGVKEFVAADRSRDSYVPHYFEGGGNIAWERNLVKARALSSKQKPILAFFTQSKDLFCFENKAKLLSNPDISRLINEKCVPVLVTNHSREGKANSAQDSELLEQCKITEFPAVAIMFPDRKPLVYRGHAEDGLRDFLKAALSETAEK